MSHTVCSKIKRERATNAEDAARRWWCTPSGPTLGSRSPWISVSSRLVGFQDSQDCYKEEPCLGKTNKQQQKEQKLQKTGKNTTHYCVHFFLLASACLPFLCFGHARHILCQGAQEPSLLPVLSLRLGTEPRIYMAWARALTPSCIPAFICVYILLFVCLPVLHSFATSLRWDLPLQLQLALNSEICCFCRHHPHPASLCFVDRVSLCISGCPGTLSIDQPSPKFEAVLLPLIPKNGDYRCVSSCPVYCAQ